MDRTASKARVASGKIGSLHSGSITAQVQFNMSVDHFVTKYDIFMQRHEPECHAEKMGHCLQCQGHSEGLCHKNMTISAIFSKLLVHLQPNLV